MRIILYLFLCLFVCSCSQIQYIYILGKHQAGILKNKRPITEVLKEPTTDLETKQKLQLVLEVREFIKSNLNLKLSDNYQDFVQLKDQYVSYVVNASPKNKLENYLWTYPIVGKMPYKGFPYKQMALDEAQLMQNQGFDTNVRGVSAYSTLGWFTDPVLSSMLQYSQESLVETIIHESVHATIYIKNNSNFNEQLATYVGVQASKYFYQKKNLPRTVKKISEENQDQIIFSKFIAEEISLLEDWYKKNTQEIIQSQRELQFTKIISRFKKEIKPQLKTKKYNYFSSFQLNNAKLMLYGTYIEHYQKFSDIFHHYKKDINSLIKFCKTLEKYPDAEKEFLVQWEKIKNQSQKL